MQDEPESQLLASAQAAFEAADFARAREITNEALSRRPDWVEARMLRAYALQDDPMAMEDLNWVLEREPYNYNALRLRSHLRGANDDLDGALQDLEALYQLAPDDYENLSKAAYTLMMMNRFEEALRYTNAMEEIEPDHTMTLTLMGEVLMHLGYFELALAWLMQATEREEAGPYYKLLAAQALYRLRQYEVAGEIIEDCAIQGAADLIEDDWLDFAEIRLELGQVQAAIECMERARATKQTGAWLALWGRAQIALGNEAAGLEALERALSSYKSEEESTRGTREYNIAWCHAYRAMLARQYGLHQIDVQADRASACALLLSACAESDVSLRYAQATPAFDSLWSMPELQSLTELAP